MATRKKKIFAPLSWLRAWRQRLTSRMACFVWGAILGNAVLSHPIQPLNLLLEPPEHMLSTTARDWLALLRTEMRQLGGTVSAAVGDATTAAVVQSIIWMVVAASVLTIMFQRLGW